MTVNATIQRFGHPDTLIADWGEWIVLLRPRQVTLGSLVLAAAHEATAFSELPATYFSTLAAAVGHIEQALKNTLHCDKINYLMLMMVDPHVHFHVIPRYAKPASFMGHVYADKHWPKAPDVTAALEMDKTAVEILRATLARAMAN
jgi:diadenosine tetraphosphate (Ap4A) HIT family hydrolase